MELTVNGVRCTVDVPGDEPLLDVLRDDLHLTGTKPGCGSHSCGACTVLLDGRTALACAVPVGDLAGRTVTTVEGLTGPDGSPHPVQRAFLDEQAAQCGWCTPAQVLTGVALLADDPRPAPSRVRERLDAVLCRCGTYQRAAAAVLRASRDSAGHDSAGHYDAGHDSAAEARS